MPYVVFNPALCSWVGGKLFLCCCTFIPVTVYGCNGKMFFGIPRQDRGVDITCLSDILCNDIFRPTGVYRIFIRCINNVHRIITWLIWILLFLLGTEVGGNKMIIEGLHTIGLEALVITLTAVAGSVLGAWGLWLFISYRDVKGGKE